MRRMRICFTDFFLFFFAFSVHHKTWDNRSLERLNGFLWNFYQTIAGKMEFPTSYPKKWGLGPQNNFLGAKNWNRRYWCRRLANDSELVCWLWHCAATAVALKRHEPVNAFNLVDLYFWSVKPNTHRRRRRDSTVSSRRRRRCVLGITSRRWVS